MSVLILCTGNSCRSQMAEMFLKSFDTKLYIVSAGTEPSDKVHPKTILVMQEIGFDLSKNKPKSVNYFLHASFDYVITVCGGANESCPAFMGKVENRLHIGFDDPAEVTGTEEEILKEFRRVRDEIRVAFEQFHKKELKKDQRKKR